MAAFDLLFVDQSVGAGFMTCVLQNKTGMNFESSFSTQPSSNLQSSLSIYTTDKSHFGSVVRGVSIAPSQSESRILVM